MSMPSYTLHWLLLENACKRELITLKIAVSEH